MLLAAFFLLGEAEGAQSGRPLTLLDVPFISQSEALCGGAAAAMVLRYWGARGLDAESFAHLVDRSASGIRTTTLIDDIRRRGWDATAIAGTSEAIARELDDGRPILTLIEDRPGTFHYIVIIGATPRAIVYHDPARTAFRTMSRDDFDRRWSAAGHWMALVVPTAAGVEAPASPPIVTVPDSSCEGLLADGIRLAQTNDLDAAEQRLTSALSCGGSAPLRELAGLRLLQRRWSEVSDLAAAAVREDPTDDHAWRLLATSRFVQDDRSGALEAWNHVDEPRVDLVRVDGLVRTRQRVVEDLLPIARNDVLTSERLTRARRQLRELPSAASAELTFVPVPSGLVELHATIAERAARRPPIAGRWPALGVVAAVQREVEVSSGAITGGGERITLGWRFWPGRPRVSAAIAAPAPWGGLWGVDAFTERQPFTDASDSNIAAPRRARDAIRLGDVVGARVSTRRRRALGWRGQLREHRDRSSTPDCRASDSKGVVEVSGWKGTPSFGTIDIAGARARRPNVAGRCSSRARDSVSRLHSRRLTSGLAVIPGARVPVLLRAHPVISDGELRVEQIGRQISYTSGEVQRWWRGTARIQIGAAAFVDVARVDRRVSS